MSRRNDSAAARTLSALALACAMTLAGSAAGYCNDYLDRSDTITHGVADATETNKAIQSIHRWPEASRHDRWLSDGERARTAVARYRANRVTPPKTLSGKPGQSAGDAPITADVPLPPSAPASP